jgi:hypothetical protein
MTLWDPAPFVPFFGPLPAPAVLGGLLVAGYPALAVLRSSAGLAFIGASALRRRIAHAAGIATVLALGMITVDVAAVPFGADINVPLPKALLFYPIMAVVVELAFHAIPLSLLWALVGRNAEEDAKRRRLFVSFGLVALLEPAFQLAWAGELPPWMTVLLAGHLFVFNVAQLWLFRRHGFFTMLGMRLVYYLWWHILWGALRLTLLF